MQTQVMPILYGLYIRVDEETIYSTRNKRKNNNNYIYTGQGLIMYSRWWSKGVAYGPNLTLTVTYGLTKNSKAVQFDVK